MRRNFHFACSIRKMNWFRNKFAEVKISAKQSAGKDKFNRPYSFSIFFFKFSKSSTGIECEARFCCCYFRYVLFGCKCVFWLRKLLSHHERKKEQKNGSLNLEKLLFHILEYRVYWLPLNFTCKCHVSFAFIRLLVQIVYI